MSDLPNRLRERGWRLTAQRRVIAEAFAGEHVHLAAGEVLATARSRLPELGRATVYATLRELVDIGELAEVTTVRGPVRYDPDATIPHQHPVCVSRGQLLDVPSELPTLAVDDRHRYRIDTVEVTFRGRCPRCVEPDPA